jgi:alpha-L-glutamate ligase-like protein
VIGLSRQLREVGVLGLNERNASFIMELNDRRLYPRVDDKALTKRLAIEAGMAVPELYGMLETQGDVKSLPRMLETRTSFVIKPASGSGGDGIIVVDSKRGNRYRLMNGSLLPESTLLHHASNIVSGQYSLGGSPDTALIEHCVRFDKVFESVSYQGVPDIRVIVYKGYPAMAMVRLPTRMSSGKANLHQGAVGAGIDIVTGVTLSGSSGNSLIAEHPDTEMPIAGIEVPQWDTILENSALGYEVSGLGYLGVDMVIDRDQGPLMLEMNARPGLNIQLANGQGLLPRMRVIDEWLAGVERSQEPAERARTSKDLMRQFARAS